MTNREKFYKIFKTATVQVIFDAQWCALAECGQHFRDEISADTGPYEEPSKKACKKFVPKGEDHGNES